MGELVLVLCGVVVKTAFRLWIGDNALTDNLTVDLTDLVRERVGNVLDQRKVRRHFEQTEELIARQLLTTLDHEYRDLDEGERNAAIIAVTTTFQRAQLTDQQLFSADLDRLYLYRYVRRAAGNATTGLSEGGIELYERVLEQCCGYVIEIADKLPGFQVGAFGELLRRDRQILDRLDEVLQRLPVASRDQQQASVDRAYRQRIVQVFDRLELFGLDFAAQWYSLSIAYVNLAITSGGQKNEQRIQDESSDALMPATTSEWIEEASRVRDGGRAGGYGVEALEVYVAAYPRLIISGRAGGGKTTVLQWLAVRAAARTFGAWANDLNELTPFLIKLREYAGRSLPTPEQFLDKVAPMLAPEAGIWPRERMQAGRALLLVDGVDELPEEQRPAVAAWLHELTELFPNVHYVLTTRPGALDAPVRPQGTVLDSLQTIGFGTAVLEPMGPPLVQRFVAQWHAAVRAGLTDEAARERLAAGEAKLRATLEHDRFLRDLADTPLLAALICALNQHLRGQLPKRRGEIFETALAMFRQRDLDRGIPAEVILDLAAVNHLLGDLALTLVRNGAAEASEADAQRILATSAAVLPGVDQDGERLYRHLLVRSGLLREPTAGHVDFVHRTFQEFLAAKALMAANHVGEIVRNAEDDQWREVVILAAGLGNTAQTTALLRGLLRPGLRGKIRRQRRLLAVASLQEVKSADPDTIRDLYLAASNLVPPRTEEQGEVLSHLGDRLLPLLSQYTPETREERIASIRAATMVGGPDALSTIAWIARDQGPRLSSELTRAWPYFDLEAFAREVLAPARVESLYLTTSDPLSALRFVPSLRRLTIYCGIGTPDLRALDELPDLESLGLTGLSTETLTDAIRPWPLKNLEIFSERLRDLGELRVLISLRRLLLSCPKATDLSVLTQLPELRSLTLFHKPVSREMLETVARIPRLESLSIYRAGSVDLSPLASCELEIALTRTAATGTDGTGFRPSVTQQAGTSMVGTALHMLRGR